MKNRVLMTAFFSLLIPLCAAAETHADPLQGAELSKKAESILISSGFSPVRYALTPTGQDTFPFNLAISFTSAEKQTDDSKKNINTGKSSSAQSSLTEDSRTHLIIDFTQEDTVLYSEKIIQFLKNIHTNQADYDITILFSALDNSILSGNDSLRGTYVFSHSYDDGDHAAAVTVRLNRHGTSTITAGTAGDTAPEWLTKRLINSFASSKTPVVFPHLILSLYRLGVLPEDSRMSSFMSVSIPAAAVSFSENASLDALDNFIKSYSAQGTENWDRHYAIIHFQHHTIWISEIFFVILFFIFAFSTLLVIFGFSFTGQSSAYKDDFKRTWYYIPIAVIISALTLQAGQALTSLLPFAAGKSMTFHFAVKILFSGLFISILVIAQEQLRLPVAPFIYGYLISLVAVANVFIFCTLDVSLIVLFAAEYMCVLASRPAQRIIPLFFSVILMMVPFVPYAATLINDSDPARLYDLVHCSFSGNILVSCVLFPFQIMWLRILVRLNIFGKLRSLSMRSVIIRSSIVTVSLLAIVASVLIIIPHILIHRSAAVSPSKQNKVIIINSEHPSNSSLKITKTNFQGITTCHLIVSSKKQAVRTTVFVSARGITPVYDSLYDFNLDSDTKEADFSLPDFPPLSFSIDYAAGSYDSSTITVSSYYQTDTPNQFSKETIQKTVSTKNTAGL